MASIITRRGRRRKGGSTVPASLVDTALVDTALVDTSLDGVDDLLPPPIPFSEIDQAWDSDELPFEDGRAMDSEWQRIAISLLTESARYYFRARSDFYCSGNMFIYYGQPRRKRRCHGPDFFLVWGASPSPPRKSWIQWKEGGRVPNILIELLSYSTRLADLTLKKEVYESTLQVPDYFCYDPETKELIGWRLTGKRFKALEADAQGRMWSEELGLWLGLWKGTYQNLDTTWLRFFTPQGELVLTEAETERQRAEAERQRAETERQRAEAERQRADAAEAELARLKARPRKRRQ